MVNGITHNHIAVLPLLDTRDLDSYVLEVTKDLFSAIGCLEVDCLFDVPLVIQDSCSSVANCINAGASIN